MYSTAFASATRSFQNQTSVVYQTMETIDNVKQRKRDMSHSLREPVSGRIEDPIELGGTPRPTILRRIGDPCAVMGTLIHFTFHTFPVSTWQHTNSDSLVSDKENNDGRSFTIREINLSVFLDPFHVSVLSFRIKC